MDEKEKLQVLKHIKLGTSEVLYYPYNNGKDPLPVRPISSFELDDCFYKALLRAEPKVAELVINIKLHLIDMSKPIKVSEKGYANFMKFMNFVDYWIVYYAMKDFQPEEFQKPDPETNLPKGFEIVLKMEEVHEIADFVLDASRQPKEVIQEIIRDNQGKEIAQIVYYLNTPLALYKDLTKLQRDYLVYSKFGLEAKRSTDQYVVSGETMTIEELLKRFR